MVQGFLDKGEDAAGACKGLMELANRRWSDMVGDYRDDITATVVRLPYLPPAAAAAASAVAAATAAAAAAAAAVVAQAASARARASARATATTASSANPVAPMIPKTDGLSTAKDAPDNEAAPCAELSPAVAAFAGAGTREEQEKQEGQGMEQEKGQDNMEAGEEGGQGEEEELRKHSSVAAVAAAAASTKISGEFRVVSLEDTKDTITGVEGGDEGNADLGGIVSNGELCLNGSKSSKLGSAATSANASAGVTDSATEVARAMAAAVDGGARSDTEGELVVLPAGREGRALEGNAEEDDARTASDLMSTPAVTPDGASEDEGETVRLLSAVSNAFGHRGGKDAGASSVYGLTDASNGAEVRIEAGVPCEPSVAVDDVDPELVSSNGGGDTEEEAEGRDLLAELEMSDEEWELEFGARENREPSREMREASREFPMQVSTDPLEVLVTGSHVED